MNTANDLAPSDGCRRTSPVFTPRTLDNDERGAILVLGIFMASAMVGILWYVAGIGDALLLRERLQESADAAAFSAAVLHARGMNLIVLLNLLMASILALRVAMKAIQAGLTVAGIVASLLPFAGQPVAALCFEGAAQMQSAVNATREPINRSISALSRLGGVVRELTPAGAIAGSAQLGRRFAPLVSSTVAAGVASLGGLPVRYDEPGRLCRESGESVGQIVTWLLHLPVDRAFFERASALVGKAVAAGGPYFCEMGFGAAPDFSEELEGLPGQACEEERRGITERRDQARESYLEACARYSAPCAGGSRPPTPAEHAELTELELSLRTAQAALGHFDAEQCERRKRAQAERAQDELGGLGGDRESSDSQRDQLRPWAIQSRFQNGNAVGQLLALSEGRRDLLSRGLHGVSVAAPAHSKQLESLPPALAFAQAEYFFDCAGPWSNADCDAGDSESMWHLRWRARLRRYSGGEQKLIESFGQLLGLSQGIARSVQGLAERGAPTPGNAELLRQLSRAAREPVIH
ncbi:MAG TPA: hypothetical protein VFQ61_13870 [Polyangiaceae bacterium]|nr:hypothetical protein [Polyangiaceae bacterium]